MMVRFQDIKRTLREKDEIISNKQNQIDNLKKYDEEHYNYNHLEIIIRPSREEFIRPYIFSTDLKIANKQNSFICAEQSFDLTTLDLIKQDKAQYILYMIDLMLKKIFEATERSE